MTFDSNTFAGPSNWQTQTPQSTFNFNFGTKIYYLDAELLGNFVGGQEAVVRGVFNARARCRSTIARDSQRIRRVTFLLAIQDSAHPPFSALAIVFPLL